MTVTKEEIQKAIAVLPEEIRLALDNLIETRSVPVNQAVIVLTYNPESNLIDVVCHCSSSYDFMHNLVRNAENFFKKQLESKIENTDAEEIPSNHEK